MIESICNARGYRVGRDVDDSLGKVSGEREEKKREESTSRARSDLIRWPRRASCIFGRAMRVVSFRSPCGARVARNAVIVYHDYALRSKSSWKLVQGLFQSFALFLLFLFLSLSLRCSILGRSRGKIHRDSVSIICSVHHLQITDINGGIFYHAGVPYVTKFFAHYERKRMKKHLTI